MEWIGFCKKKKIFTLQFNFWKINAAYGTFFLSVYFIVYGCCISMSFLCVLHHVRVYYLNSLIALLLTFCFCSAVFFYFFGFSFAISISSWRTVYGLYCCFQATIYLAIHATIPKTTTVAVVVFLYHCWLLCFNERDRDQFDCVFFLFFFCFLLFCFSIFLIVFLNIYPFSSVCCTFTVL